MGVKWVWLSVSAAALALASCGSQKPVKSASTTPAHNGPGKGKGYAHDPYPSTYKPYPGVPTLVRDVTIFDGEGGRIEHGQVLFADGKVDRYNPSGYKVAFVPFSNGRPSGKAEDVVTGFVDAARGKSLGRPVGVAIDKTGALLIADDVGNTIWRVTAAAHPAGAGEAERAR